MTVNNITLLLSKVSNSNNKRLKRTAINIPLESSHFINMYQQCFTQITNTLANWSMADVRTVPGIMYQIRCGADENDPSIEYQFNWFNDCTETFIHNHSHSFDSLCLEGEYTEKSWEIKDDNTGDVTYRFYRKSETVLDIHKQIPGTLCHVMTRNHFPGNILHVDTDQYHSISPKVSSDSQVFTFLAKRNYSPRPDMYVLSSSPAVNAPSNAIRPATEDERQKMYNKLQHILQTKFQHSIQLPHKSQRLITCYQ